MYRLLIFIAISLYAADLNNLPRQKRKTKQNKTEKNNFVYITNHYQTFHYNNRFHTLKTQNV
jgi:hypothetical protein